MSHSSSSILYRHKDCDSNSSSMTTVKTVSVWFLKAGSELV